MTKILRIFILFFFFIIKFGFSSVLYHELNTQTPLTEVIIIINSGSIDDADSKDGISYFTSSMLDNGIKIKNKKLSKETLAKKLETFGITFSTYTYHEYTTINFSGLSENFLKFIKDGYLRALLFSPTFDKEQIEIEKNVSINYLIQTPNSPDNLIRDQLRKRIFKDHPYSKRTYGNLQSIKNFTRDDLENYHKKYFKKENFAVFVSSNKKSIINELTNFFKIKESKIEFKKIPEPDNKLGKKMIVLRKTDLDGSRIILCSIGKSYSDDTRYSFDVIFKIFHEDVYNEIRNKNGIGYGVGARVNNTFLYTSLLCSMVDPVPDATKKGLEMLWDMWKKLNSGYLLDKIEAGKKSIILSYPFELETTSDRLHNKIIEYLFNLPKESLSYDDYTKNIEKLTQSNIKNALQFIDPENTFILVLAPLASGDLKLPEFSYKEYKDDEFLNEYK
jgi:zinc protease